MSFDREGYLLDQLAAEHSKTASASNSDIATADSIRDSLFPRQRAVLQDRSRRKAVLCPRRAGKTYSP